MKAKLSLFFIIFIMLFFIIGCIGNQNTNETSDTSTTTSETSIDSLPTISSQQTGNTEHISVALNQLDEIDYTPNILEIMGLNNEVASGVKGLKKTTYRAPATESLQDVFTEFPSGNQFSFNFNDELSKISYLGMIASNLVVTASDILTETDIWVFESNSYYYLQFDADSEVSTLTKITSNDTFQTDFELMIITGYTNESGVQIVEVQYRHDFEDTQGHSNWVKTYISMVDGNSYSLYHETKDFMNDEYNYNTHIWEIKKDAGIVSAVGRFEHNPSGTKQLNCYLFYPGFSIALYNDFYSTNLLVFSPKGILMQSFLDNEPYEISFYLASLIGWDYINHLIQDLQWISSEVSIQSVIYRLSAEDTSPISISDSLSIVDIGDARGADGSIIDFAISFSTTATIETAFLDIVLGIEDIGLTIDPLIVIDSEMFLIIQSIFLEYDEVLSSVCFSDLDASQEDISIFSMNDGVFQTLLISDDYILEVLTANGIVHEFFNEQ